MSELLIVIDMQNDFIDGPLGSDEARLIVKPICGKIESFVGDVIYTRDTHFENYLDTSEGKKLPVKHCIRGTEGHRLCPQVAEAAGACGARILDKETFGCKDLPKIVEELAEGTAE